MRKSKVVGAEGVVLCDYTGPCSLQGSHFANGVSPLAKQAELEGFEQSDDGL